MRIIIAGGGIGGLTLALMLHQRGLDCQVNEAAAELRPMGVGINALPHSIRELAALGLLPRLDRIAIRTRQLTYSNHLGQQIWSEPRGLFAGHDVPQFSVHRGRLHAMLWQAATERLGSDALCSGRRLVGYTQHGDGVVARFQQPDGSRQDVTGDALIGADGIHSALRASLHPDDPPVRWNGTQMWRGAVEWPAFDGGDSMVIAGDAVAKLVLYPIAPGNTADTRLINWVIYAKVADASQPPPRREDWSRLGDYRSFRHLAERLHLPFIDVGRMIRQTGEIFEYPMCDRDPLPWWTQARVSLLGDAAHPMYPVGSNGASQAILDARCLADLFGRLQVPEALAAYQADRLPATASVVQSNRTGGPERVIDLIATRAPLGFARIEDVATETELVGIVKGYAQLAGFSLGR
ncbi:flavin-dependent oxidoreductase [Rhodopila sp.]|uniref:flavin-dependent oxidoreductase n=1 Tax=Rhodopila sp. TaxID=2480087 RepID=UPI003D0C266A